MDTFPQILRCAARQLDEDKAQVASQRARAGALEPIAPNLLIKTGPDHICGLDCPQDCEQEHGFTLPMLSLKGA